MRWWRALVVGVVLAWALARALARPAQAAELDLVVTRGDVMVRAERAIGELATRLADRAAADLARIAEDLPGLRTPPRIEIRVVDDVRELAAVAPAGRTVPSWAVGVAFRGTGIVAVATGRAGVPLDAERTLAHELAHLALDAALGPAVPRWLHEGFAQLHAPEWSPERAETLFGMAWMRGAIPIRRLDADFPAEERVAHRAYAQSYDFVEFLARRGRWADGDDDGDRWPWRRFLGALVAAEHAADVDAAAIKAFGVDLDVLFDEWHADLQARYMFLPVGVFVLLLWLVASVLLVLAWRRRRRQNTVRLARWARDEAAAEARARAWEAYLRAATAPPPSPELDAEPDPDGDPRWLN
ncbi:MAG: peptidase MA family metallohydrolase [Kofleriaceae bacterium]